MQRPPKSAPAPKAQEDEKVVFQEVVELTQQLGLLPGVPFEALLDRIETGGKP